MNRLDLFKKEGYNVMYIWESDFICPKNLKIH